jgi:hypothetical protein
MITTIGPAKLYVDHDGNTYVRVSTWLFNNMCKEHHYMLHTMVNDELFVLTDIPWLRAHSYDGMLLAFSYMGDRNIYKLSLCCWKPYKERRNEALKSIREYERRNSMFGIKNVIHHDPATIVYWCDGTKTVVKCSENDIYDPEKGLAMAISKKVLGNEGNYYNEFKKWLPKEEDAE